MKKHQIEIQLCHQKPERSFFIRGKQFPLCARCTGIHLGYLSYFLFLFGLISMNWWISLLMVIPTYLDGFVQAYTNYESNNPMRFFSGIIAGIGSMSLLSILGQMIGQFILDYII